MHQLELPGISPLETIVNVASVKHRSPFRYPGGKTWLVPRIRNWLSSLPDERRHTFIEPFAGGAIVGLSVAFEGLSEHVILVECDDQVAAVWSTIISLREGEWLAQQIESFDFTETNVERVLDWQYGSVRERAFQTIIRNRVSRGGILAPGAGLLKYGENGKGIASRWYPNTLARRIRDIDAIAERLAFVHGDGMEIMRQSASRTDAVFFIDPPYSAAGKKAGTRLYTHAELDHNALFRLTQILTGDFLMTYNLADRIKQLASKHGFQCRPVAMKNTHHARMTELLIGRNLDWM